MKVNCLQENLNHGLTMAGRIAKARTTLPITQNVLIIAIDGAIKMQATDLETSLTTWTPAQVEEPGGVTVPLKILHEFVNTLPKEPISLEVPAEGDSANYVLTLKCLKNKAHINGAPTDQFPPIPEVEENDRIEINPVEMSTAIDRTEFCASREENRPVLTGVNLRFKDQEFAMAAADGYRLAVQKGPLETAVPEEFSINLPANFLKEMNRIKGKSEEPVRICLPNNRKQALFEITAGGHGDFRVEMTTQLLEGDYPEYEDLIPTNNEVQAVFDGSIFLQAVQSTAVFSKSNYNKITLDLQPGENGASPTTTIFGSSEETGDNRSIMELDDLTGEVRDISFNHQYMRELLGVIGKNKIRMETSNNRSPGVFRIDEHEEYIHVVMPIMPT